MSKFESAPKTHEEDYHSIKDDTSLVSVYSIRKVIITKKKPSTTPFPPPNDDRERDEILEATLLSLRIEPETRNENPETINNDDKEEKKYDKKDDDNDDDDNDDHNDHSLVRKKVMDFGTRIEPETRNENPETINNDDKEEKKYDKKDDDDNADHNDHSLVRKKVMGSVDTKNEKMQTLIPSPLDPVRHTYLHIRPFLRN
nr:hypothetical protein [Tanacetum cinerariifolium]